MNREPTSGTAQRAARLCFAQTLLVLIAGLVPVPAGWARARSALESARAPDLNRADREAGAGGYYEGLIGGGDSPEGARGELAMRLLGKPSDWVRFHAANVSSLPSPLSDGFIWPLGVSLILGRSMSFFSFTSQY